MIRSLVNFFAAPKVRVNWKRLALPAYAAIGLLTFGYNASTYPSIQREYIGLTEDGDQRYTYKKDTFHTGVRSGISGALWPLYWTWEIAEGVNDTPDKGYCTIEGGLKKYDPPHHQLVLFAGPTEPVAGSDFPDLRRHWYDHLRL